MPREQHLAQYNVQRAQCWECIATASPPSPPFFWFLCPHQKSCPPLPLLPPARPSGSAWGLTECTALCTHCTVCTLHNTCYRFGAGLKNNLPGAIIKIRKTAPCSQIVTRTCHPTWSRPSINAFAPGRTSDASRAFPPQLRPHLAQKVGVNQGTQETP